MAEITALELVVIEVFDHRFQYRQELQAQDWVGMRVESDFSGCHCNGYGYQESVVKVTDDGISETAAAHRTHLGLHQTRQIVGDFLIGNGGTQPFGD